jgi:hypothetical protein
MATDARETQKVVEAFDGGTGTLAETQKVVEVFFGFGVPFRESQKVVESFDGTLATLAETQKVVEVWYVPGSGGGTGNGTGGTTPPILQPIWERRVCGVSPEIRLMTIHAERPGSGRHVTVEPDVRVMRVPRTA